ncbi:bi-domain-containing oxidoreductase [Candidatus Marimicrobium litorale]|uniref:Dehydrogenase n=1 Tax=Candidatus Marimicrobium litorale TaxID=2518991 RepID=A0ABT3T544_9GAMM|nr:bi-domain-containing oxidoreductase [Candidatus Marimicrobium litorale]MCX2977393.1 dehydrogenase [Candidatus Marimicrobium litorale]
MKKIFQDLKSGETRVEDVLSAQGARNCLLITSLKSLVSVGTERMLVDFGKANLVDKALQQPDKVKQALQKIGTDGLMPTVEAIRSKLDQPLPLGYSNVGIVSENGGTSFSIGDRVVSNGHHAEVVRVPKNLCALIPDNVDDESAAFTVLGAIALQGTRLAQPTLGEVIVVTGLGLVGLLTVQLLRAQGCRVLGIDFDSHKCELARSFGASVVDLSKGGDPLAVAQVFSRGRGVDGVIITASTKSNEPVHQAATMCRQRGRIVLVGVVGLELSRADFYEKELTFQVSCSYGPGRYDSDYEEKGYDYPVGFVRWTQQRNFEAVLDMMASGALDVKPLITHRFAIDEAPEAYKLLDTRGTLGIVIDYPNSADALAVNTVPLTALIDYKPEEVVCSFVGGGNYASRVLIPAFAEAGAGLHTLVTSGGVSAVHQGKKYGFAQASTDLEASLVNEAINTVVISTQHKLHAQQIIAGLNAGKQVFVEKPLALTLDELESIDSAWQVGQGKSRLMVGYNRRFSPLTVTMKVQLDKCAGPKTFILTMNAGDIPAGHWTQDREMGGGRVIGEACHYIDLLRFLVGAPISGFTAASLGTAAGVGITEDKASITLTFEDGSMGTIHYFANGGKAFPKERIEAFGGDGVLQLDNFKRLKGYGWSGFKSQRLLSQDKGQNACAAAFVESIRSGQPTPIPYDEIMEVARVSIEVAEQLRG